MTHDDHLESLLTRDHRFTAADSSGTETCSVSLCNESSQSGLGDLLELLIMLTDILGS